MTAALTEDGSGPRLDLVTLRLAPDEEGGWSGTDVQLTEAGVGLFNHVYAAGDAFDPLTVR
ncbi:HtaA domain-containing protein [Streptomyces sp. NPDC050625]|uniref:HtaA domain-containing protein n=1 Tax=Streptomyces sp. NPDC050625 TaxID=3154629 RepID=UPI00343A469A